jgi:hypothetical protein
MKLRITTSNEASEADYQAILKPLHEFNITHAGDPNIRPLVLLLTDESGSTVGGLWGQIA